MPASQKTKKPFARALRRTVSNPLVLKRRSISLVVKCLRFLLIVGLCYLFLFPLFYLALAAFSTANSVDDPSVVWIPKALTLENFKLAYDTLRFGESAALSAVITIFSTLAAAVSCSLVGYGFARFNFFGRRAAFLIVVLMIIVPPQTLLLSSYMQYRFFPLGVFLPWMQETPPHINLLNTPWVFILPAMFASGLRCGLFIFIFRQFFMGLPKDLEEAACIDGCGAFKTFFRIIVPITTPAFVTVILFSIVWHWNDLYTSSMLFNTDVLPITAMLDSFKNNLAITLQDASLENSPSVGRATLAAGALMTVGPPLLLYVFTQRFFVESIERTGIVG